MPRGRPSLFRIQKLLDRRRQERGNSKRPPLPPFNKFFDQFSSHETFCETTFERKKLDFRAQLNFFWSHPFVDLKIKQNMESFF